MNNINVGIPIDSQKLLDTRLLVQAGSGGGKSWLLRALIESLAGQVQQIVIDPEGEFVTLREKFDFALVSKGGDIPLSLKYAETLAHKILETGISVIIDLYELPQHERILFVKRFLQALINVPKELWHPCFIHIDEAHIFCPESSKSESTAAVIDLCTRGRKRGFAAVLATQRLPKLNKDATAECNNKLIGRSAQDIDRKRAGEELGMANKADVLAIRHLQPGEFYAFGPAISTVVKKFKVGPVVTTHLQSGKRMIAAPPTPKAIQKILSKLSDISEEAERELQTKQQFQAEISRLKNELSKAPKALIPDNNKAVQQAREDMRKHYTAVLKERDGMILSAHNRVRKLQGILAKVAQLSGAEPLDLQKLPEIIHPITSPAVRNIQSPLPKRESTQPTGNIQAGPLRYLKAAAMFYPEAISKKRMCAMAGTSFRSSTHRAYMAYLKREQLLDVINPDTFKATEHGVSMAGELEPLPAPGQEMIDMWCGKLGNGPGIYLRKLAEKYPAYIRKEDLAAAAGTEYTKSTHRAYMAELNACQLIETTAEGVKASDELFEA